MKVVPFVHEGLGNSSYLVELADRAAVLIDPDRSVDRYLSTAKANGWTIQAVFETHLHADFVSGVRELAHVAGAELYLPKDGQAQFSHQALVPSQRIRIEGLEVEAVASPGHRQAAAAAFQRRRPHSRRGRPH